MPMVNRFLVVRMAWSAIITPRDSHRMRLAVPQMAQLRIKVDRQKPDCQKILRIK